MIIFNLQLLDESKSVLKADSIKYIITFRGMVRKMNLFTCIKLNIRSLVIYLMLFSATSQICDRFYTTLGKSFIK